MLAYFFKINIAIALFYSFYRLFFYKDTFFTWRRIALLCAFFLSATYPLLNIQTWVTTQEPMAAVADLYATIVLPEFELTPQGGEVFNWKNLLIEYSNIIYWGIVILLFARFFIQLSQIIYLIFKCPKARILGVKVHLLPKPMGPFSFFHWIFLHPETHTREELDEILTHEQAHACQWHSVDIIISELTYILCWFNPFAWLMKREVRTNLEYMADDRVLETGYDSKAYQYHLLGLAHHKAAATIYNSFNVLPLKKRIKMMNTKRTKKIGRTKYLMFIPLAALLMIVSNIEAVAHTTKKVAKDVMQTVEENLLPDESSMIARENTSRESQVRDSVPQDKRKSVTQSGKTEKKDGENSNGTVFEVVEQMPQFPNGGMEGLLKYLSKNVKYPVNAKKNGIQGRVVTNFVVNKNGSISNVRVLRSVDTELDKEAIRVISSMPNWKPGIQRGEAVRVKYTLPIMFRLDNKKDNVKQQPVYKTDKGVIISTNPRVVQVNGSAPFEVVEQMPQFPGGQPGLMQFIAKNIKYPESAQKAKEQGTVFLQLIVDKDGKAISPKILRSVSPALDAEAIRLINAMPKWKPGKQKGEAVAVKYTVPIKFKLQ